MTQAIFKRKVFFAFLPKAKKNLACLMEGKTSTTSASSPTRKKRSTSQTEPKYGCPEDFKKVTEYLCLHLGDKRQNTLEESRKYCEDQNKGSTLLYFLNSNEASKVWYWLGKLTR